MKELTLKEIQTISLEILNDVHEFCQSNNIHYTLAFGTLLGAVRHKGFIPWDDDVDIMMPRPDYERFCKNYKSNDFVLMCIQNDKDYLLPYAHVCDMKKTIVKTTDYWTMKECGIKIDVFPIDNVSDNINEFEKQWRKCYKTWKVFRMHRSAIDLHIDKDLSLLKNAKRLLKKVVLVNGRLTRWIALKNDRIARRYEYASTKHWGHLSHVNGTDKSYNRMDDLSGFSLMDFENHKFYVLNGYDNVLRCSYGDYMQLPPLEDRCPHHSFLTFYKE